VVASIFFEFSLPNAATWFYFSFLLANAVFFKFDRFLSFRNWDVVSCTCSSRGYCLFRRLIRSRANCRPNTVRIWHDRDWRNSIDYRKSLSKLDKRVEHYFLLATFG